MNIESDQLSQVTATRLTILEKKLFLEFAKKSNLTKSEYLRTIIRKHLITY